MSEQEFEAYLRLMSRFLRLSDAQRSTIGRELRGHMEERLEDLIDRGFSREDAVNTILDEFGDAAALAGEFGRIGTRRKWIMRTTVGTVGVAAAVLFVSFLLPENRPLPSPGYTQAAQSAGPSESPMGIAGTPAAASEAVRAGLVVGNLMENPADSIARNKLSQTIAAEFPQGTGFEEVLEFVRQKADLSIAVNWNALAVVGIDRTTDTLGMNVKDVKIETVLDLLLENISGPDASVGYAIVDGVVRISTLDHLDRNTVVRIYDVSDLIHRDLPAAIQEAMRSASAEVPGGPMMGGGGGGFGLGPQSAGQPDRETIVRAIESQRVQALEELIRTTIQRGTWAPEGAIGTLSYYEGLLVVDHTARAHQSLADLLSVMRQALTARPQASARPAGGFPGATPPGDAAVPGFGPVRGATARGHGPMGLPGSTRPADSGR